MGCKAGVVTKFVFCIYFAITSVGNAGENVSISLEQTKTISKRYDLDFQTCAENFDIRKDKIIRTQDSRAMGAKYINEIDVSSREECLRMCCETNTCDVFVFEEKNPGSCYLFHCGTPDDFKCKFTKHHNYTSAILSINRHMTELENQIKLTRHEEELTRLRKPENAADQTTAPPFSATTLVPPGPPAPKETVQVIPASSNSTTDRRCSRYQFECHSSGECIAIYNACDGIAQCSDGSDEAQELDCPSLVNKASGGPRPLPAAATSYNNQNNQQQQMTASQPALPQMINSAAENQQQPPYNTVGQPYRPQQNWPQAQQPLQTAQQQQPQQYGVSGNQNNNMNVNNNQKMFPASSTNQQQQQQQGSKLYGREGEGPAYAGNSNNLQWQAYQQQGQQLPPASAYQGSLNQYQGGNNREFEDQSSHIFNHKGNGLVADSDSPAAQYNDMQHSDYKYGNNGPNNYYNNGPFRQPPQNWQPAHQPSVQDMNPVSPLEDVSPHISNSERKIGSEGLRGGYNAQPVPPDYYYEDSQEGRFHTSHAHESEGPHQHAPNHAAQGEQESIADGATPIKTKEQQHTAHKFKSVLETKLEEDLSAVPKRKGSASEHQEQTQTNSSTDMTTPKTEVTKSSHDHISHLKKSHKVEVNLEEINISETTEDEPGRPSGAIMSLALGLCITGIMVVLIGCRLRVVRRRLRRSGKSPYAHDADYLVNGMYL